MTKLDTNWFPEIIPGFDPQALREKIRAEIREETEGMTEEEILEYFRLASERAILRRKAFARRQKTEHPQQNTND